MRSRFLNLHFCFWLLLASFAFGNGVHAEAGNPIIHADVPDLAMIRVGDTYYMSSTTMHMSPGLPIMKSKDLVNWQLVSYVTAAIASTVDSSSSLGTTRLINP